MKSPSFLQSRGSAIAAPAFNIRNFNARAWVYLCFGYCTVISNAQETNMPEAAKPPEWIQKGAYVYRINEIDEGDAIKVTEESVHMVYNLLDKTVPQIVITNGFVGHEHTGNFNWDGLWPFWDKVTFRGKDDWKAFAEFMRKTRDDSNTYVSFHVNVTDVNAGLKDYPESREFLKKMIATKSLYRRDWNKTINRRDGEAYVPKDLESLLQMQIADDPNMGAGMDPISIMALVNYKNFWDSGLAKEMIDGFYSHLPYAPPVIYLDVFNAAGGNFSTGFPDGALGGSEETQIEGMKNIVDYLHSKGSDVGTEGDRSFLGANDAGVARSGYVWEHGTGFSTDDYRIISGANSQCFAQHVWGNPTAYAPTAKQPYVDDTKAHYAALLAGKPGTVPTAGTDTLHIRVHSGGDDWPSVINNFYLTVIQELYHIGNRATRTRTASAGNIHLGTYTVTTPDGEVPVFIPEFFEGWQREGAMQSGHIMLEDPITTKITVKNAGTYSLKLSYYCERNANPTFNVYVNGELLGGFAPTEKPKSDVLEMLSMDLGAVKLKAGENSISFDQGSIGATWTDGTVAEWKTPSLGKGFTVTNGDVTFAYDYDRMWPDTWSGQKKIYFFSWDGTSRTWKLPKEWRENKSLALYPLTPDGRGQAQKLSVTEGSVSPKLLPQVPYVLVE